MIKKFIDNVKKYVNYLMTVGFADLFINVLILVCILVLSTFIFVPIGLIETLLRDFILLFVNVSEIFLSVFNWIFNLISSVLSFIAFVYMFNRRFDDIDEFKKQFKDKPIITKDTQEKDETIELPKTKQKNEMKK